MAGIFSRIINRDKTEEKRADCAAVIAAGGSSSRMNGENKLFIPIGGVPCIARTLLAFQEIEDIGEIIVVSRSEDISGIVSVVREYGISKLKCVIFGGESRLMSVLNGVAEVSKRYKLIAIHDGARPLVTAQVILSTIESARRFGAAAPSIPVKDTIKTLGDGVYKKTAQRNLLAAMQTPQVFHEDILKAALNSAAANGIEVTDDAQALELIGISVVATMGSEENIKITTPMDLIMAEAILQRRGYE